MNFCMGGDIAAVLRQRRKAANLYFLQLLFGARLYRRLSADSLSPVKGNHLSSGPYPHAIKYVKSHEEQ